MCKHHSVVYAKQTHFFNPIGKEDSKWSMVILKPRYSELMESGVLNFVPWERYND